MEVITIVNQKGGAAKTTTAMNLAATLGKAGRRTLLVDLDPQATLTRSLGVRERWNVYQSGLTGVVTKLPNVELVPGGPDLVKHEMALTIRDEFHALRPLMSTVSGYDYVILDCPPNLYGSTVNAIVAADRLLLPAPLDLTVLQSLGDTIQLLESIRAKGLPCPTRVAGVLTIYKKLSIEPQLLRVARAVLPDLLETRIRVSSLYPRSGFEKTAAVLVGGKTSAPVVDHLRLAEEMRLLA